MTKKALNFIFYAIAFLYLFLMLDLLFRFNIVTGALDSSRSYNLIPFATISRYLGSGAQAMTPKAIQNVFGNIAVFIPCGLYLQVFLKNKVFGRSFLVLISMGASIEIIQMLLGVGVCDIDDLILNCLGGIIGILLYKIINRLSKNEEKAKMVVTILSLIVGPPVIFGYFFTALGFL